MDQTLHRVTTKEKEEVKRTTKQKMQDDITEKEGTTWIRKATMEDIDGGLHPAVDGQSLDEDEDRQVMPLLIEHWQAGNGAPHRTLTGW